MPLFVKGGNDLTPFGPLNYLRSVKDVKFESYTFAASTLPSVTIDGHAGQKILPRGVAIAKITAGPEAGKVGCFQAAGTNEVQTLTKSGTISGGTYTLTVGSLGTTTAIAWDATAATVQAALEAVVGTGYVNVTGGPIASAPFTVTFGPDLGDVTQITADTSGLTGSTPGITPATSTGGAAGSTDGRDVLTNIVGLNDTFLPWQLIEGDREIAVAYEAVAVQGWCLEMDANGNFVTLSNTTADAMVAKKTMNILFK